MAVATIEVTPGAIPLARRPPARTAASGPTLQRCGAGGCTCGGRCHSTGSTPPKAILLDDNAERQDDLLARQLARAVTARSLQRAPNEAVPQQLTSPRFMRVDGSPEPLLVACLENRARLNVGARDTANTEDVGPVAKVQQALIDLNFDLGPTGADGQYGPLTSKAVKSFKAAQKLGFEHIGDVGPGTMRRLDQLFPPTLPTCPAPDDTPILGIRDKADDLRGRCNPKRHRDPEPGACPPAPTAPGICGPDVSAETERAWRSAQAQFKDLPLLKKLDNCRMLIQPLIPDRDDGLVPELNANAFDTLGLFQVGVDWTRRPPWHPPCCTPGSPGDPTDPFDPLHECETVCSNTVQIGSECWLAGTVNYGLFGIAMRACHDLLGAFDQRAGIPFGLPAAMALAGGYKAVKGDNIIGPERWVIATWKGGPAAKASGGNRKGCAPTCPGPPPPTFSIVWEPNIGSRMKPRP